ncbi:hemolysin activation/secretion protein [Caulobacter sp. AP07]|nr:hemolysin activation/secretion protein [Caulobacter sp. AP07]
MSGGGGKGAARLAGAAAVLGAGALCGPVWAQTAPDAGSLQRQLRQEIPRLTPTSPTVAPEAPPSGPDNGRRVAVARFVVDGATLVPASELEALLRADVGRSLSFAELQAAAQKVAGHYRTRGYFARAYLPAQDVSDGAVHIAVIEGRFGRVLRTAGPTRADRDFVESVVAARLTPGAPYSVNALERGLLLAGDLPGIAVRGTLKAGATPGASDLELTIEDEPFATGRVGVGNFGVRSTGVYQATAALSLNNGLGRGDQLQVQIAGAERLGYGAVAYSLPLGADGWRAGIHVSTLGYRLGGDFKDLDSDGAATTLGGDLSYPLVRGAAWTLRVRAGFDHGRYDDNSLGRPLRRKRIDKGALGLMGEAADDWGGGGFTTYAVTATWGALDLSRLPMDKAQDAAGPRAAGGFSKFVVEGRRDQRLARAPDLMLRGRIAGQWAFGNLDSSEQFSLGGPDGVRAYPVNEAAGDSGILGSLEVHGPIAEAWAAGLDGFAFVDAGLVRQHADTWKAWNAGSNRPNSYSLFGAGFGLAWTLPDRTSVSFVVACPIGSNRGADQPNHNQDGGVTDPRAWLSIAKLF